MEEKSSYSTEIGEQIREIRKSKDMTLSLLAKRSGLSKSYLSHIETGKVENPSVNAIKKVANALGMEMTFESKGRQSDLGSSGSYSGSFHFPFSAEDMEELASEESEQEGRPADQKTIDTLKELADVLTDPEIPIKDVDEMEDKILSYAKWLRDGARTERRKER
ncbi:helix-turn-helix transcriptional regulator [Candidatus Bipolaricaulota bacterium]|nr:helix-turn-helix transcriptional regulator [Candidatus Bipolaricaulota bacterium]